MHKAPDQNKRFILQGTYQNIHLDGPCQKILLLDMVQITLKI